MSNIKYIICAHQFEDEWNCGADINKIDTDSFDAIKKYLEDFEIFDPKDMESSKDVSLYGTINRIQILGMKVLPHRLVKKIWMIYQELDGTKEIR